ncbi:MAG TPA: Uma2 family endonuclease, partial [Chitinophagaceae bacterium]|nr:Uma2 family endonuclease [Chitinophagaceae bacterium]
MKKMAVLNPPRTMFEVFESLPEGTLCQLINNNLVMSPAPSDPHQKILMRISSKLFDYVDTHQLGEVRVAPYDVYFNKRNVYQPDIVFIANENIKNIQEKGLFGAPDLVIEILSPKTAKYDLEDKRDVYERYGVKEYWAVDPASKQVYFFKLV